MNKTIKIRLHVLTPIHIGCDDVYEPTSFVIDEKKKKLIEFDPIKFISVLNQAQRDELIKTCLQENLLLIYKFIRRSYNPRAGGREVEIADGLIEHYKKVLQMSTFEKQEVINRFEMHKTAYNPLTRQPYIPGSSLKGAIRTAYLSDLAKKKNIKNFRGMGDERDKADKLETLLLDRVEGKDKIPSDPFRMVKVSDLMPVNGVGTRIVYAINRKKKKSDKPTLAEKSSVYQIFEVILPGAVFEGILNINKPLNSSGIKHIIAAEDLLAALNAFYIPLLENGIRVLKEINVPTVTLINKINEKFKGKINKTAFFVSIGRHSGAEAVTIEGNRHIKIMQGKGKNPKYLDHTTTTWLSSEEPKPKNNNGLLPFGWAVIEVIH